MRIKINTQIIKKKNLNTHSNWKIKKIIKKLQNTKRKKIQNEKIDIVTSTQILGQFLWRRFESYYSV